MVGFSRRLNMLFSGILPEKRVFIQSGGSTRYIRLTPLSQLGSGGVAFLALVWLAVATSTVVVDRIGVGNPASHATALREAVHVRLEELAAERDRREAEARSAQGRFQLAMEQVSKQQTTLLESIEARRELETAVELMRGRLEDAVAQRDTVAASNERLLGQLSEVSASLTGAGASADLTETLRTVSGALSEAVAARDAAAADRAELAARVDDLELRMALHRKRQDEMVDQLEQAVAMSFGPLEAMFDKADLDVEALIAAVKGTHSGQGGPLGEVTVSTRSFDDPGLGDRFDQLMTGLDRMNLMRIAANKIPYALPVEGSFRFTSGFGPRGRRLHAGVDLAAPVGTTIVAAADGVVTMSGRDGAYGNIVRIRHEFGFETVYAHLSKIRVRVGQQVSRGVQIGDMGSTGRSTGSHLHYEVRVNGRPQNPMTYLEAAKDVF